MLLLLLLLLFLTRSPPAGPACPGAPEVPENGLPFGENQEGATCEEGKLDDACTAGERLCVVLAVICLHTASACVE
jgi:hypothetical protein